MPRPFKSKVLEEEIDGREFSLGSAPNITNFNELKILFFAMEMFYQRAHRTSTKLVEGAFDEKIDRFCQRLACPFKNLLFGPFGIDL